MATRQMIMRKRKNAGSQVCCPHTNNTSTSSTKAPAWCGSPPNAGSSSGNNDGAPGGGDDEEVVRIKFLSHPRAGFWMKPIAEAFERRMNGAVTVEYVLVDFTKLFPDIVNEAASQVGLYDGFVAPPSIAGSVVKYNGWADLTPYIQESEKNTKDWSDILLGYRKLVAQYEEKIIMYPLDGDLLTMFYRKDVLDAFGLQVPRTWEEYGDVAKATHGKVFNNETLSGSCIGRVQGCADSHWATLLLSSMTQTEGSWSGHLFDTADMKPLTGAAMEQAVKWMETQVAYGDEEEFEKCIILNAEAMKNGTCVLSYNWGNTFKRHLELGTHLKGGLMGVSRTPGSTKVLDRATGELVDCDADRCKHGDYYEDLGWVNRAPYLAFGGWACAVNNYARDSRKKRMMTEFCAFASSMEESIDNIVPEANSESNLNGQDPYRESHLNVDYYVTKGYERETAKEYLDVIREGLDSDNAVVENRFPVADKINSILEHELHTHLVAFKQGSIPEGDRGERRAAVTNAITNQWVEIIRDQDRKGSNQLSILESYQRLRGVYMENENMNQIGRIRVFGLTAFSISVAFCAFFAFWTIHCRKSRIVRSSQPLFLVMICVGALVLALTILPYTVDDGIASVELCSKACMSIPWLLTTGWVIVFSAIHSKLWRINKVVKRSHEFRRVHVSQREVLLPFVAMFLFNAVLLTVWTLADPAEWVRVQSGPLNSYGKCSWAGSKGDSAIWKVCLSLIVISNVAALLLALVEVYRARQVSVEYGESKYIGIALVCIAQISLVGLPLLYLVEDNPTARYFLRVCGTFITVMSILLLVFVPKVYLLWDNPNGRKLDVSVSQQGLKVAVWRSEDYFESIQQDMTAGKDRELSLYKRKIVDLKSLMAADGIETDSLFRRAGFSTTSSNSGIVGSDDRGIWGADYSKSSARSDVVALPATTDEAVAASYQNRSSSLAEPDTDEIVQMMHHMNRKEPASQSLDSLHSTTSDLQGIKASIIQQLPPSGENTDYQQALSTANGSFSDDVP